MTARARSTFALTVPGLLAAALAAAQPLPSGDVKDLIFANGFEEPVLACGWDTRLGAPGGSLASLGWWQNELYVGTSLGGPFSGVTAGVARIDLGTGQASALASTELVDGFVTGFVPYDDGDGERLYVVGAFNGIRYNGVELPDSRGVVAWNGSSTATLPGSPFAEPLVFAQAGTVWNGHLVIGGAGGAVDPPQKPVLTLWDGQDWQTWREQFEGLVAPVILATAVYDGDLYFAGRFDRIRVPDGKGGQTVVESKNIMGFDGEDFFSVGGGVERTGSPVSQVLTLASFDDGSGEALYLGGRFNQSVTGTPMFAVAKWDGATLSAVGAGFPIPNDVRGLKVYDDGSGPALYATGTFSADTLGTPMRRFARLVDGQWQEVAGGVGENPGPMQPLPDGALAVGGSFDEVGSKDVPGSGPSNGLAELVCSLH